MTKIIYTCPECASENVFSDAYVGINDSDDVRIFDSMFCMDCSTHLRYLNTKKENAEMVADLLQNGYWVNNKEDN